MRMSKSNAKFRAGPAWAVLLALALAASTALANPAMKTVKTVRQPEGTELDLHLWGDEFANGWETAEGYTVRFDARTGFWVYAVRDDAGGLTESTARAGIDRPVADRHLRPTAAWLKQRYLIMGEAAGPYESRAKAAPPWASGSTNILIIMVQFPPDAGDPNGAQPAVSASFSAGQAQANMFGATSTGPGNLTEYYDEISFGALDLVGTVVGPYTLANDKNDYDDGPLDAKAMVAEAIALADADVDFNDFDNDSDGWVDNVAVMYAGNGPDNGLYDGANSNINDLWPHASSLAAPVGVDGINAQTYFIAPELLNSSPRLRTIGVYAHEFGHKLGLPDLYDTNDAPDDSDGLGHWCLMASGSWCSNNPGSENGESPSHMSAWCKWFLGWVSPTDLTASSVAQSIPQAETNAFAVLLGANPGGPNDWPGGSGEFFLVENRQRVGFDIGLDGCGLMVWHVDESLNGNQVQGHTAGAHRLVDLEEADGLDELDSSGTRGDTGDPFPGSSGNTEWGDGTYPHSRLYDGTSTDFRMKVLSESCGATMDATFGNRPPVAVCQDVQVNADEDCLVAVAASQVDNGSSDPDGDPLTFALDPPGPYGLGVTGVTLIVTDDKGESDTCTADVTVVDVTPPVVACPADITVECSSAGGALKDDPQLAAFFAGFTAEDNCDPEPLVTNDAPALFPGPCDVSGGVTTVTWTATDDSGNASQCSAVVTVIDTTPPVFDTLAASRDVLWPPNHKMSDITVDIEVSDTCDASPTVTLISAASSQPDNGTGDGDTVDDIQGVALGTDDREFSLRSERAGNDKDGRLYTITYQVVDCSGNAAVAEILIRVPHHQSQMAKGLSGFAGDGASILPAADKVEIVVYSATVAGEGQLGLPQSGSASRKVPAVFLADKVMLGNSYDVVRPSAHFVMDVDADEVSDLVLAFPAAAIRTLLPTVPEWGALEIHLRTDPQDGDHKVKDIFRLGEPLLDPGTRPKDPVEGPLDRNLTIAPNPFNPQTELSFALEAPAAVRLAIYNVRGELVRRILDETLPAGRHSFVWDGRSDRGGFVASGHYLVRFERPGSIQTRKILLLK